MPITAGTSGLMTGYVISHSWYQGGQGEISNPTEAKGTELFTSQSYLSMVRSRGYGVMGQLMASGRTARLSKYKYRMPVKLKLQKTKK